MAQELTIEQRMEQFKKRKTPLPDIAKYDSEYNVEKHKIFTDLINFPDREAEVIRKNEKGEEVVETITIPRNRIGLPYQKRTVNIATTFLFGNPVQYTNNLDDDTLYIAFKEVVSRNKMIYFDKDISNSVGRWKECAELWYDIEGESEYNSFKAVRTLKVKLLTPDIYNLYPVFDQTDNLVSFGREFSIKEANKDVRIFEVYTATEIITYRNEGSGWTEEIVQNLLGKIPIVYYSGKIEWEDVQTGIERLERIYSNVGESNDKFAFPILALNGEVEGSFSRDRSGKVLMFKGDGSGQFLAPPQANENLVSEITRLDDDIHTFTNTPNIFSIKNIQGMGNMLAGENAEFIFLSAHLKVMDKLAIYIPALQRRASIIKSFLQSYNIKWKSLELDVEPIITPFIINNESSFIRMLMEANGNQPIYSQEYSMEKAGIKDVPKMQEQLNKEQEKKASTQIL